MKVYFNQSIALFAVIIVLGCSNNSEKGKTEAQINDSTKASDSARYDEILVLDPNRTEENTEIEEYFYPEMSETFEGSILVPSFYHGEEVSESDLKKKWFGLFKNNNEYFLEPSEIVGKRVNDAIVDDENGATGWEIKAKKDSCIFLLSDVKVKTGAIENLTFEKEYILPNEKIKYVFKNNSYEFWATGTVEKGEGFDVITNYKLYLKSTIDGEEIAQMLVAIPYFEDSTIDFIFGGDIDGDGYLDLLLNTSNSYNGFSPTLYISGERENGKLLKIKARHNSIGC